MGRRVVEKNTLAKALQHTFEEPFLHVSLDKIIGWMAEKVNDCKYFWFAI